MWPQRSLFIGTVPIGTICQILVPIWSLFLNFGPYSDNSTLPSDKIVNFAHFEYNVLQLLQMCNSKYLSCFKSEGAPIGHFFVRLSAEMKCPNIYSVRSLFPVNLVPIRSLFFQNSGPYLVPIGTK